MPGAKEIHLCAANNLPHGLAGLHQMRRESRVQALQFLNGMARKALQGHFAALRAMRFRNQNWNWLGCQLLQDDIRAERSSDIRDQRDDKQLNCNEPGPAYSCQFEREETMNGIKILAALTALGFAYPASALDVSSSSFGNDGKFADKYVANAFGCSGQSVSPQISWKDAPTGTKSFAVTMYDPDAPTGSGFWHWLVYNIPPTATELPEGAGSGGGPLPDGAVQGRNDAGMNAYMGPCPPQGDAAHHYVITVFAVDVDALPPDQIPSAAVLGFNLHFHTLEKASMTYTYGR